MSVRVHRNSEVHPLAKLFPVPESPAVFFVVDRQGRVISGQGGLTDPDLRKARVEVSTDERLLENIVMGNLPYCVLTGSQVAIITARMVGFDLGPPIGRVTIAAARELMGVKEAQAGRARTLTSRGSPQLIQLAWDGAFNLHTASRVAVMARSAQDQFVLMIEEGLTPTRALRQLTAPPRPAEPVGRNHATQLSKLNRMLGVVLIPFQGVGSPEMLDRSVTAEMAESLLGDLSKRVQELNRIKRLLKEVAQ